MTLHLLSKKRLMTPGPTDVPPPVLLEMAQPVIHHRTEAFREIFRDLSKKLQWLCRTEHPVLTITGSGTTAFEAAQCSLATPDSRVLTVAGGKFGERWQDVYDAYAPAIGVTENIKIDLEWGQAPSPAQIEEVLDAHPDVSVVTVVHSETSTATACNIKAIAEVVQRTDALLIVDGITSVGAMEVEMDEWGIDVLVTGSQKALMMPPGLGFVALGPRALKRLESVGTGPSYNLDLRKWLKSWENGDTPFTAPVNLVRGQRVALEMLQDQGLEAIWARVKRLASATREALSDLGLRIASHSPSDSVTALGYPEGIDDAEFRAAVRDRHGVHLAGGQNGRNGQWKGKIFRISHMGYVDAGDTLAALHAIETELNRAGVHADPGSALAAAAKVMTSP
ncbi:MAG: alanine--glyoxylate aminotransferase family protein [Phycisphaeraceae bacterium]|nr:alanine--glyoxylate aminotransferase family protein [Phycisphaeraceae bacterium]